MQPDFF